MTAPITSIAIGAYTVDQPPVTLTPLQAKILAHCAGNIGLPSPPERPEHLEAALQLIELGALTVTDTDEDEFDIKGVHTKVNLILQLQKLRNQSSLGENRLLYRDNGDGDIELVSSENYTRVMYHPVADNVHWRNAVYIAFLHNHAPALIDALRTEIDRLEARLRELEA